VRQSKFLSSIQLLFKNVEIKSAGRISRHGFASRSPKDARTAPISTRTINSFVPHDCDLVQEPLLLAGRVGEGDDCGDENDKVLVTPA
jgi:hypothetical protein